MVFLLMLALTAAPQEAPPVTGNPPALAGQWRLDQTALLEATLIRMTKELGRALTEEERNLVVTETKKTKILIDLKADGKAVYLIDMGMETKPIDGLGRWHVEGDKVFLIIRYKWGFRLEPSQQMTGILHGGVIRMALARGMPEVVLRKQEAPEE